MELTKPLSSDSRRPSCVGRGGEWCPHPLCWVVTPPSLLGDPTPPLLGGDLTPPLLGDPTPSVGCLHPFCWVETPKPLFWMWPHPLCWVTPHLLCWVETPQPLCWVGTPQPLCWGGHRWNKNPFPAAPHSHPPLQQSVTLNSWGPSHQCPLYPRLFHHLGALPLGVLVPAHWTQHWTPWETRRGDPSSS